MFFAYKFCLLILQDMLICFAFFILLFPGFEESNILITAPFKGSHYFAMADIGILLAEQGHSVSFLAMMIDPRYTNKHENFTHIPPYAAILTEEDFNDVVKKCIISIIKSDRPFQMYTDTMVANTDCQEGWVKVYQSLIDFYTSKHFLRIINTYSFDLIIAEERTILPILAATNKQNTPVVSYIPELEYSFPREVQNLPMFFNSEPSLSIQIYRGKKPGFWYRLSALFNLFQGTIKLKYAINQMLKPVCEEFNITNPEHLLDRIHLFIINDHIAMSFPYQRPNNVIQIGGSSVKAGKPLQGEIKSFVEQQEFPIVLVSVGTYIDITWMKWYSTLITVLEEMDIAVILKLQKESEQKFSKKFFISQWLPQRDLLASGKIDLFISHCGNNGRIETILYNVPVLCTPIFAEQGINGEIVQSKEFGEMLLPQEMTTENIKSVILKMLHGKSKYAKNMKKSADIFRSEPTNGSQKLLYYLNILLKDKNLDFLVNKILKEQSSFEMYHLDLICFVLVLTGTIIFLTALCLTKLTKYIFLILRRKKKNE